MKKILLLSMVMLVVMALAFMISCSKDDDGGTGGSNITVVVNENGTTSNGSIFSAIDDKNFYLDYIKYTVEDGHLVVTSYDKAGFKGVANIVSRITYKGNTYEVLKIGGDSNDKHAFSNCPNLTSVTIPNSVIRIGDWAFYCCSIASVTIPNSVTSIGSYSFMGCGGIISLTIPSNVTSIGKEAFDGCGSLNSIIVEEGNTVYDSRDNCNAIIETSTNNLIRGCKNSTIPNSVISIGRGAFSYCSGLTIITIPNSVKSIDEKAFFRCSGLTSVIIGNSVKSISGLAFASCNGLKEIHSLSATPPSLTSSSFAASVTTSATLYVPTGSRDAYKNKEYWEEFQNIVEE